MRKKYPLSGLLMWTRWEIMTLALYATAITLLFELMGWHWLRLPWTPIALIGTAVAFLIGFQNNAAYGRIWEARQIWGGVVNDSRTWTMMVKDLVTNEYAQEKKSESELAAIKTTLVHRHIAWITALRYAMRKPKQWETFLEYKTNKEWVDQIYIPELTVPFDEAVAPLLSNEELEYINTKTNKAAALLALQSKHIRALKELGVIWEFSFLELEGILGRLFEHQGKSERIKNFPYPRQFATLGYDFVKLFALVLPLGVIPEFSKFGAELMATSPIMGQYFVWAAIPFTTIVAWVFNTMQRIGTTGENPFEGSGNDVPISTIARGIEIDLREMMDEAPESIPEALKSTMDVQM